MTTIIRVATLALVVAGWTATAGAQVKVSLPEGAVGYRFGKGTVDGLVSVTSRTSFGEATGPGFGGANDLSDAGGDWPDPLSGTFVGNLSGKEYQFQANIASGEYLVWLCAGPIIRDSMKDRHFLLKINDQTLTDEAPTDAQFESEKYLFRFLGSQYSEKPEAFWARYIDKMYPSFVTTVKVTDGKLTLAAANHFISALIAVPAAKKEAFASLTGDLRKQRIEAFAKTFKPETETRPKQQPGDGDALVYAPADVEHLMPWSGPTDAERMNTVLRAAGAPGQRVMMVLAVVPFAELGKSTLTVSDLTGSGTISAKHIRGFYKNYRYLDKPAKGTPPVGEMVLVPSLTLDIEKGVTQSLWLWLEVPPEAQPGQYKGTFTLKPQQGKTVDVPVEFEVYPFKLQTNIPAAYGFWGTGYNMPYWSDATKRQVMRDRLASMREVGLTSFMVDGPSIKGLHADGTVDIEFKPMLFELAKEVGMAANPQQPLLDAGLMASIGRQIGARLPGSRGVSKNPGIELKQPEFKKYFIDGARQYAAFIAKMGVPTVVTAVDEPREGGLNSWNRNYDDTVAYLDMMKEAGLTTCVNPMRDQDRRGPKDYTGFIDHCDVLSTHAWDQSAKFMKQTVEKKKTLWLYNCGKDRFSCGFYNWHAKSSGRWEWHLCVPDDAADHGYPGREWFNPFTGMQGLAQAAPSAQFKGGVLYQTVIYNTAEGVVDYTYLYTLEQALQGKTGKAADEARAFLATIDKAMPAYPQVKGLGEGAGVGTGAQDEIRGQVSAWRGTIAGYLKQLKN